MSFLDKDGFTYFYNKIKTKFISSITAGQETLIPDNNGNVTITNVATADNLTSPDGQSSYGTYIYRTSGGDVSLESGEAELIYIDGNVDIRGRVDEVLRASATNNIQISVNPTLWRASTYGSTSGEYTFNYSASTGQWSPALTNYGLTASNIVQSTVSISVSGSITSASVDKATWETKIVTTGNYLFTYDGTYWNLNGSTVDITTYGIVITGTLEEGDIVTVSYTAATPDSIATVEYIKKEQGTIYVAKPSAFEATGFNQFDSTSMVLENMTISNGYIVGAQGSYVCYCKAVGGVDNGYVAYSEGGYITDIGWCADLPQEGREVVTDNQIVTTTLASIPFEENGYVVVVTSNINDLCIHPKWSGRADEEYEEYVSPSVINFPTTGLINNISYTLPLATYGMPAIGNVADRLNLDAGIYIQKIGHLPYSSANLITVQGMNVDYDYDNTNIFYVLTTPISYTITIDPTYIVNDFGTEEFIGTVVPVVAQSLYGQNLRDKLRNDVELKKLVFTNITVSPTGFTTSSIYSDFGYRKAINLSGVTSDMIPDVILNVTEATSGIFAPVSETFNGGIYLYTDSIPDASFTIPVIIVWR